MTSARTGTHHDTLAQIVEAGRDRGDSSERIATDILQLLEDSTWSRALAHPTRGAILKLIREHGALSPVKVSDQLASAVSNVAYHFGILSNLGLIEIDHEAPRRGATEHFYRLSTRTDQSGR